MPNLDLQPPHVGQLEVLRTRRRFNALACGRRWGKTQLGSTLVLETALDGFPAAWFAPTYKLLDEAWERIIEDLRPIRAQTSTNRTDRVIKLPTGGRIDFWTLSPTESGATDAGRGRKYKRVVIDEAAMVRYLENAWTKAIRPTLSDYQGDAYVLSTPRGHNYFHRMWTLGQKGDSGWMSWRMPTGRNPYIRPSEIEAARQELPADAYSQEYAAEFLADASNPFGIEAIRKCIAPIRPAEDVVVWGVDLAKSVDWTVAIALDAGGNCRGFQRWQSDWRNTTRRLAGMIGDGFALVDSTGVGDPVLENIQADCPGLVEGYKFTSSSKQQLMEGLAWAIQNQAIAFPEGPIQHELEVFQYEYRPSGVRYSAPEGMHDDCVMALALAWRALQMRPAATLSVIGSDDPTQDARFFDRLEDDAIWQ